MRTLTLEGIYHDGFVEIQDPVKFKDPMRVLVVFIDELKPKPIHKFSFAKSLELTKNCKGKLSDEVINERCTIKYIILMRI